MPRDFRWDQLSDAEFQALFPDENACLAFLKGRRWPEGVSCPRCGNKKVYELTSRPWHWQCADCASHGYRFSVLVGTPFENTKVSLCAWFGIIHHMLRSKGKVTISEIRHLLGSSSYKTAWNLARRIRAGLRDDEFRRILGLLDDEQTLTNADPAAQAGFGRGRTALQRSGTSEAELRYRRLFEAAIDGILILDAATLRIVDLNPAMAQLLGHPRDEIVAKQLWEIGLFRDTKEGGAVIDELRADARPYVAELTLRTKDGRAVAVELISSAYQANGKSAIQCNIRDISARKRSEQEAAAYMAMLTAQQQASPDAIVAVDPDGRVISFNQRYVEMWAIAADAVTAQPYERLLQSFADKLLDPEAFQSHTRYLHGSRAEIGRQEIALKDGRTLDHYSAPMMSADGRYLGRAWFYRDITERKLNEREVARLAWTDAVTGLPNRTTFNERLGSAFASVKRGAARFAVLYLDVDRFRSINDALGHQKGDLLLREIAARLKGTVRETDLVARFGGDEFAILQSSVADPSDAGALAAKLRSSLAAPYRINGSEVYATVSIGISLFTNDISRPDVMISQADLALYRAKDRGRNQYCFHPEELDAQVRERVGLAEELRSAITRNELELYYQPQVELASGRIAGMEALVRWNHPNRGVLKPAVFVPLAEKTGGIRPLGHWVLGEAFRQAGRWRDQGIAPPVIGINLSASQFKVEHEFEETVADDLRSSGIAPDAVELELNEAALMETSKARKVLLKRLRELGFRIAVDDFGAGYSSLEDLRGKKVNRLKIAQKHVRDAVTDPNSATIVRASIGLARELGIDIIAPGVEAEGQRDFLAAAGCRYLQGFYVSEPVQAERATQMLIGGELLHGGRLNGD